MKHREQPWLRASKKFGLNVNENKCKILVFNFETKRKRDEDIETKYAK